MNNLVRDLLEGIIVLSIGAIIVESVIRLRKGKVQALVCRNCNRPTSRAYPNCKHCGTPQA